MAVEDVTFLQGQFKARIFTLAIRANVIEVIFISSFQEITGS